MHEHLNDDEAERLLSGADHSDPLAVTLESIRRHWESVPPPAPDAALSEFVSADLVAELTSSADPLPRGLVSIGLSSDEAIPQSPNPKERRKMSLSTIAGTVAGKVLIGASVAAASVGGAQVAGVVDIPVLPDVHISDSATEVGNTDVDVNSTIEVEHSDSSDDSSSTSPTTVPTSSTVAPDSSPSTTLPDDAPFVVAARTFDVLDAGTVTIEGDSVAGLTVSAAPADGWTTEIESDDVGEAAVKFRNGDDRVDFSAEIDDGQLRIRIEDHRTGTREEFWYDEAGNAIAAPVSDDDSDHESDDLESDDVESDDVESDDVESDDVESDDLDSDLDESDDDSHDAGTYDESDDDSSDVDDSDADSGKSDDDSDSDESHDDSDDDSDVDNSGSGSNQS